MTTTGPNVLASVSNQSVIQGYRPRLIEFYGYEGEDFRHFQEILDSYLAVSNTQGESRKIAILKSQLRRAAKIYFERVILKEEPDIKYDQAIEALKNHYITPELIQSYEMEFNDMFQGEQEHPQIFLARLREAADLANIDNEALIESRFRAGLLNEIKNFCIQSSSKNFKDWLTHSEGWWNANRPHIDERPAQILPVSGTQIIGRSSGNLATNANVTTGINQLSTMDVVGYPNDIQYYDNHSTRHHHGHSHFNNQQEILNMIQKAIRNELNLHDQQNRPYNRNARNNYNSYNNVNSNGKDNYPRYNNNNNSNHNYNHYNNNGYNVYNTRYRNSYDNAYGRTDSSTTTFTRSNSKKLDGSIVFNNESNGQSNTQKPTKSINQSKQQLQKQTQHLNAILTENENRNEKELYTAIRPDKPPEVTRAVPYTKTRTTAQKKTAKPSVVTKRVTTRSRLEEIKPSNNNQTHTNQDIEMETDLPIEPIKKKQPKRTQSIPSYDIATDILDRPANATFRDLINDVPKYRRQLAGFCRTRRTATKNQDSQQTVAIIEDDEFNTTAVYSKTTIGDHRIRTLIDCGAAKTCMSKALADKLGLSIDAASETIFTMGNGTKQAGLGVIYDVPVEVKENMIIPCTVEVLPSCPTHFILGNNWLIRAKAKIDFNSESLKVSYKNQKAELPITFLCKQEKIPKITTYTQTYKHPVSQTNSNSKHVHFEEEADESTEEEYSSEEESIEHSDEDIYSAEDELSDREHQEEDNDQSLLVLEKESDQEIEIITNNNDQIIRAPKEGMILKAYTSSTFQLKKPPGQSKSVTYSFELTNPDIIQAMGYFDLNATIVLNNKSIEIHLYNRSKKDIHLQSFEKIGKLEKIDLQNEEVIQAYQLNKEADLYTMEYNQNSETESDEEKMIDKDSYAKVEVGDISKEMNQKLRKLLYRFKEIFDWDNNTIGYTSILKHKIIREGNIQPISHRPYRLSPIESDYLQKELDKYCKLGVIAPSNSPWAAPVTLVKKKNGEYRMVIDYRKLNAVTKKDSYPLPRIDDLLDTLGKAKVFSALDMRAGFHQVPLEESSKELTAFTTKYGVYHYNTLPMGLVNSPATFQRLIDLCFRPLINKCLVAYIDDLNVYSNNCHEHLVHLEHVFNCIKMGNLKLNPEKCFFFKDHLKFLGYIVTKE
ncbi:hypothetical protein RO3G_15867 [Rhizopus delemar RA 99-880]|uniref:Reverse transcriptase domain-containing protein n=1 Tax=Rhizopus delemar (strain RA 99-880 / ATCC MYA-4621 / FGSC 9543 / NRRL 43880) TaxID=246409 RepID=I1CRS6_RHIO9|nr:hypothetical protein RO3G_15867 [Rhizopus delemar RA 99-880]|eukprot:EIE91156.1 hypothetical protein RO3G_15867 [Rhizopus delemar RA 99-880]